MDKRLLSVSEAADALDVSPDTVRRWEKKGLIKGMRSGNNYRLFSLDELRRIHNKLNGTSSEDGYKILVSPKKKKIKVIELFAGAGGTALGFENAGLQHILLNEIDKNAVATLKKNRPDWNVVHNGIENIDFRGMEADVVEGGFPCQSFSYAGKRFGFEDTRGTLFYEFARCIKEVRPKIAMGENVRGLLNHDNGKTLQTMVRVLNELGYKVHYKVVRAQYLDVPQKRERLVIFAIREGLDTPFIFPKERDYTISLKEALKNCPDSPGVKYTERKHKVMSIVPEGGYWRDLPVDLQKEYMGASYYHSGGKTGMARRLSWYEPSLTLTCNPAQKQTERCHPSETRPLTVREYARIQTFPDEWEFVGSTISQYKQIGNAVPVNMAYHLGESIIAMLDGKFKAGEQETVEPEDYKPVEQLELIPVMAA